MVDSSTNEAATGLEFWLQWQVLVSALIFIVPAATAIALLRKRGATGGDPLKPADLWAPCWRNLHPRWLLFYRAFAFVAMAFLLYQTVAAFGLFVFFFYTQWTFALVVVYFALATIVSIQGCRIQARKPPSQAGERDKFLNNDSDEKENKSKSYNNPTLNEQLGFMGKLLQMVYLTCAGAVMLTDIVFWGLLLPFMAGENFKLTLLIGCMHSVNAVFLTIELALNRMPFSWFGLIYFVLFSCIYGAFQWILHACCLKWWPYPFLDLSTPWAPLWYLALVSVHVPFYGLFVLLTKAKDAAFSRMFPLTFMRVLTEKKQA